MATLNGFSVTIPESYSETSEGHVGLRHGQNFKVRLHNGHRGPYGSVPCDATIILNGKDVGTFRVNAGQTTIIERPANDTGKFTAYQEDSYEAASIGIDRNSNELGLIEVVFRPGNQKFHWTPPAVSVTYNNPYNNPGWSHYTHYYDGGPSTNEPVYRGISSECCAKSCSFDEPVGMGIGLSGKSDQNFHEVEDLDYNEPATRIYLRLVKESFERSGPRPLRSVYSTDIPRKL